MIISPISQQVIYNNFSHKSSITLVKVITMKRVKRKHLTIDEERDEGVHAIQYVSSKRRKRAMGEPENVEVDVFDDPQYSGLPLQQQQDYGEVSYESDDDEAAGNDVESDEDDENARIDAQAEFSAMNARHPESWDEDNDNDDDDSDAENDRILAERQIELSKMIAEEDAHLTDEQERKALDPHRLNSVLHYPFIRHQAATTRTKLDIAKDLKMLERKHNNTDGLTEQTFELMSTNYEYAMVKGERITAPPTYSPGHYDPDQKYPIVHVFCGMNSGASVLVNVHGFEPFFHVDYIPLTDSVLPDNYNAHRNILLDTINDLYRQEKRGKRKGQQNDESDVAANVIVERRENIRYYKGKENNTSLFYRIAVYDASARRFFQQKMTSNEGIQFGTQQIRWKCTYSCDMKPVEQFLVHTRWYNYFWANFDKSKISIVSDASGGRRLGKNTTFEINVDIRDLDIIDTLTESRITSIAPLRIISWDIEMMNVGEFPSAEKMPIIEVGFTVLDWNPTSAKYWYFGFHLGNLTNGTRFTNTNPQTTRVFTFNSERDLLQAVLDFFEHCDGDLNIGHNIDNFDWQRLSRRCELYGLNIGAISRVKTTQAKRRTDMLVTRAFGAREMTIVDIPGSTGVDLLAYFQREWKNPSNTLNYLAGKFLGEQKDDVSPSQIPIFFQHNSTRLMDYCFKDTILPIKLGLKLQIFQNMIVIMSRVSRVLAKYLYTRGQSIRVLSLIRHYVFNHPDYCYVIQDRQASYFGKQGAGGLDRKVGYQGATVLKPQKGFYDVPVTTLDFSSLYPSIMMAHNLSYDTFIPRDSPLFRTLEPLIRVVEERFRANKKELYEPVVETSDKKYSTTDIKRTSKGEYFVRQKLRVGILCYILSELIGKRNWAKGMIKKATDDISKKIWDGVQLVFKILANSIYGYTGAETAAVAEKAIADAVTAYGRVMIDTTKTWVETTYTKANGYKDDAEVLYGDSVTGDTPILICENDDEMHLCTIDSIPGVNFDDPSQASVPWAHIASHRELKEHVSLEHRNVKVWSDEGWSPLLRVIRHIVNKAIYRVTTASGSVCVTEDHSLLRENGAICKPGELQRGVKLMHHAYPTQFAAKTCETITSEMAFCMGQEFAVSHDEKDPRDQSAVVPMSILQSNRNIRECFWRGCYFKLNGKSCRMTNQKAAASLFWLLKTLDYSVKMRQRDGVFWISNRSGVDRQKNHTATQVVSIEHLSSKEQEDKVMVYDLETSNHHFSAGVGEMVVHNTDSVMIAFSKKPGVYTLAECFAMGPVAAQLVTQLFEHPIKLEFEKIYFPFLLLKKKKYAAPWWSNPIKPDKLDQKGLESVRRDWCLLTRELIDKSLRNVLMAGTPEARQNVLDNIHKTVVDLYSNEVDLSLLVTSKQYRTDNYKNKKQPHLTVNRKMKERGEAGYNLGDRIPFVFVPGIKGSKDSENAEDPRYVLQHGLPIDAARYVEKAIKAPIERLLVPVFGEERVAESLKPPMIRKTGGSGTHGVAKFFKQAKSCKMCSAPLENNTDIWCGICLNKDEGNQVRSSYINFIEELKQNELRTNRLWSQCHACQSNSGVTNASPDSCQATDCPIFYVRTKSKRSLQQQRQTYNDMTQQLNSFV